MRGAVIQDFFCEEAVVIRRVLSDGQWGRIKDLVPGKESERGVTGDDNRLFLEAVLWVVRTGVPCVNGGAKWDRRGGVKRDHLAAVGLSP